MNILYCGNDKIEDGLTLSVLSLLNNIDEPLCIYVLTMRLKFDGTIHAPIAPSTVEYLDRLAKKEHPESFVSYIDITDKFLREMPTPNLATRFTPYCMLRLFADEVAELPDKILYLDTDVICRRDCREFYHQDISGCEIAGVLDHYGSRFFRRNIFRSDYLNSGVLLMNLRRIRETGLLRKCRQLCARKRMFMPDQSALNKCATAKKTAARKFNEQRKLREDTVLQHFSTTFRFFPWLHTLTVKPWQIDKVHGKLKLHEYDALYDEYARLLPEIKEWRMKHEQESRNNSDFLYD